MAYVSRLVPRTLMLPDPSQTRPPVLPSATKAMGIPSHVYGPNADGVWCLYPGRSNRLGARMPDFAETIDDIKARGPRGVPQPVALVAIDPATSRLPDRIKVPGFGNNQTNRSASVGEPSPAVAAPSSECALVWPHSKVVESYMFSGNVKLRLETTGGQVFEYSVHRVPSTRRVGQFAYFVHQFDGDGGFSLGMYSDDNLDFRPTSKTPSDRQWSFNFFAKWWARLGEHEHIADIIPSTKESRKAAKAAATVAKNAAKAADKLAKDISDAADELGGDAPTSEAAEAIALAVQTLAGLDPDGAKKKNAEGFNRSDSRYGRHLAAKLDVLTPKELIVGRGLAWRYRGQIPADLVLLAHDGHLPA